MQRSLISSIALAIKYFRKLAGLSQEDLADKASLDRTYISGVERGVRNITLESLEKIILALEITPADFFRFATQKTAIETSKVINYFVNFEADTKFTSGYGNIETIDIYLFERALNDVHCVVNSITQDIPIDIFSILGIRNLSAFIGELFAKSLAKESKGRFICNPHQDGYPDLLLMDESGKIIYQKIIEQGGLRDKSPFSPFANGGIEIKATCGSVPTPAQCAKLGTKKPDMGETRISVMHSYDWKAHHRETNNLVGILWDFLDSKPHIVAVFFGNMLTKSDWGKIVKPKEGGGRTTSVSIMKRSGVKKMYQNWIAVKKDTNYINFINQYNHDNLIQI